MTQETKFLVKKTHYGAWASTNKIGRQSVEPHDMRGRSVQQYCHKKEIHSKHYNMSVRATCHKERVCICESNVKTCLRNGLFIISIYQSPRVEIQDRKQSLLSDLPEFGLNIKVLFKKAAEKKQVAYKFQEEEIHSI